ncbi:MAG: biopolymer transporter Tol [Planctomycetota bacterium]|nr:MAG: biopolymer transporter Tol [Planctomycetota bacterium]REJ95775.1 MAG: biopolymer transporter Tol [Planctomycetota bacterium]REK25350.1 MAG: biopolymer transporter Tol [Planctomycetota bacterium]REK43485.1 MAG: biopolymer transporter Tol [Planctomycetota bacterium]
MHSDSRAWANLVRSLSLFVISTPLFAVSFPRAEAEEPAATASHEARHLADIRQVTFGMDKAGEGYFSPDGQSIVYQAIPPGYPFYQIYTQALVDGQPRRLSPGRGRTTCSYFSPDGESVIYASSHLDPNIGETESTAFAEREEDRRTGRRRRYSWVFDKHMDIFRARTDGSDLERLTDTEGYDAECAFSPDGKQIVFCSDRDGDPDLYIMNADGSDVRQLTDADGYDGGPFFSPDGEWVAFRSDREKEDYLQIYVIRTDGSREVRVTNDPTWVNWAPYWHPTEPYLIWCGADHSVPGRRPNYDLWMVRYETDGESFEVGPKIQVTDHASADVLPVFSPDGKSLMWTSTRGKERTSQLWIGRLTLPSP